MTTEFGSFEVNSTLELVASNWNATFVGSEPLRTKTKTDIVTMRIGLLNDLNEPQVITAIKNGPTDEFEITAVVSEDGQQEITGAKNGRSSIAAALDYQFKKRYIRLPETGTIQEVPTPGPTMPEEKGRFQASTIAAQVMGITGLTFAWGIPSYELMSDFIASGRVIDTLKRLVRPWQFVAPFQADIFDDQESVQIKQRNPFSVPDFTISIADARRSSITLRVRKTQKYGTVTLRGKYVADELEENPLPSGIGNVFIQGTLTETQVSETFDSLEVLISRVVTTSTYVMPSKDLLREIKETYTQGGDGTGLFLSSRDIKENVLEPIAIDTTGPVQQVKIKSQIVTSEGFDDQEVFRVTSIIDTGYAYDENQFLSGETSKTRTFNTDTKQFEDSSMVVKTMRDIGSLLVEQVTEVYGYSKDQINRFDGTTFQGDVSRAVLQTRDTQTQGGHRPGGPGRARPVRTQSPGNSPGGSRQITLSTTFSSDPDTVDVEESDPNLDEGALAQIMAQFAAAHDIWQYELMMDGVNMPWIKRGMYIQFENFESEIQGTLIPLPVMLVTEVVSTYDESDTSAKSKVRIRAFGWSPT